MMQQQQQLGAGAVGVQILGDGNSVTIAGAASLALTRFKDLRGPGRDDSPAARLTAARRLTEFVGRQDLRDRLTGWLDGAERFEVRTLTGEGGSGKTRLALELCDQRHQAGWATGFVARPALERFIRQPTPCWRWDRPVLAVIDYAASWGADLRDWLAELAAQNPEHPIRVLLLERGLDEWHEKLFASTDSVGQTIRHAFGSPVVEPLDRIDKDAAVTLFDATYRHETGHDPRHGPGFRESLAGKDWGGRPLFVMAAASRAAQGTIPDALALTRRDLVDHIAARELARLNWVPAEKFCAHCVAAITLRGGLSKDQARDMIAAEYKNLNLENTPSPNDLLPILSTVTCGFRPVEPDIIGGALILVALGQGSFAGEPNAVAQDAVKRALAQDPVRVATTLMRLAQDFSGVNEPRPLKWLNQFFSALDVRALSDGAQILQRVYNAAPIHTTELRKFLVDLLEQILRSQDLSDESRAKYLVHLGMRYSAHGNHTKALEVTSKSVEIFRTLVQTQVGFFEADLSFALNNLGIVYSKIKKFDLALLSSKESVDIYRKLDKIENTKEFNKKLAELIASLSNRYIEDQNYKSAIENIDEALTIFFELEKSDPEGMNVIIASAQNNKAELFLNLNQPEKAMPLIEDAVSRKRVLADAQPDAFTPGLAKSLGVLGMCYHTDGDPVAAAEAFAEGIQRLTPYFAAHPAAFTEPMSALLRNYRTACDAADRVADEDLLAPVAAIFAGLEPSAG